MGAVMGGGGSSPASHVTCALVWDIGQTGGAGKRDGEALRH